MMSIGRTIPGSLDKENPILQTGQYEHFSQVGYHYIRHKQCTGV